MFYVYILQSQKYPTKHYTGFTEHLVSRLEKHNNGEVPHTTKYKPWNLITYTAFHDKKKALEFEDYLKSHSGRAFAHKHY